MLKFVDNLIKVTLELLVLSSLASVVYGVFLYSLPMAFIVGGILGTSLFLTLRVAYEGDDK